MPITIKTNTMKYKNPTTGEYTGFNAIAQETTEDQIALINSTASEKIAAIQAAASDAQSSIPLEYSDLVDAVNAKTYDSVNGIYAVNDYVWHEYHLYRCISEISTPEVWTAARWVQVNVGGELSDLKSQIDGATETQHTKIQFVNTVELPFDFVPGTTYRLVYSAGSGTVAMSTRKNSTFTERIVSDVSVGDSAYFTPTQEADAIYLYVSSSTNHTVEIYHGIGAEKDRKAMDNSCVPIMTYDDDYPRVLFTTSFSNVVYNQHNQQLQPAQNRLTSGFIEVPPRSTLSVEPTSIPTRYGFFYLYVFSERALNALFNTITDTPVYVNTSSLTRWVMVDIRPTSEETNQAYPCDLNGLIIHIAPQNRLIGDVNYHWVTGYYINSDGAYVASDARSVAVIDCAPFAGGKMRGYSRLGTGASICAYDSNGVMISCLLTGGADLNANFTLDVPSTAKYILASCGDAYIGSFYVKFYGIANGINNAFSRGPIEYDVPPFVHGLKGANADFPVFSERRLEEIYEWWSELRRAFSRNLTLVKLGKTTTPEGRYAAIDPNTYDINAYVYQGDDYISGNDFIIYAAIHGAPMENEVEDIMTGEGIQNTVSLAYFVKDMLCNPSKNSTLMYIRKHCRILFVPIVNPWGYKNGTRSNGRGVDCNRNFDLNFVPNAIEYQCTSGTEAFSENETRLLKNYIVENFPNAVFGLDLHTRGAGYLPTDTRWLAHAAKDTLTTINAINSNVADYLTTLYEGLKDVLPDTSQVPNAKSYFSWVQNIPVTLIECACAMEGNVASLNGQLVQEQYVRQLGMMVQEYVDKLIINPT